MRKCEAGQRKADLPAFLWVLLSYPAALQSCFGINLAAGLSYAKGRKDMNFN